jgi:prepilin-type processing-associated H-X9-DG protein/prepilin-type N-terminal cleavage/methylation domain-containing protein
MEVTQGFSRRSAGIIPTKKLLESRELRRVANFDDSVRMGFTLIELAVTLAVLGLLVALLLPAVQASRESARQSLCQHRQRQLLLAVQLYHDTHGALIAPSHGSYPPSNPCCAGGGLNRLFPYLELPSACELMLAGVKRLPILTCPSDGELEDSGYPRSYFLNEGAGRNSGSLARGPFQSYPAWTRLAEVTDGASQTAALSEQISQRAGGTAGDGERIPQRYLWGVLVDPVSSFAVDHPTDPLALQERVRQTELAIQDCRDGPRWFIPVDPVIPYSWIYSSRQTYSHWIPPNTPACSVIGSPADSPFIASHLGAASLHPGGVNVAFLDGHVRIINESIDRRVYRAMGTSNGQDTTE